MLEEKCSCCNVEAVVSADDRGQMVLPKELRDKAGIKPGDKIAIVSLNRDDQVCCLAMIKADLLADMVKGLLGPLAKELTKK